MIYNLFLQWQEQMTTIALLYARILPIFILVPALNSGLMNSILLRNTIIFFILIGLWPSINGVEAIKNDTEYYLLYIAREGVIGAALGFALALPFWMFAACGSYIDMARGASVGDLIDPTNGQESNEVSNYIDFCVSVLYFELGGITILLETLVQSYKDIGVGQNFHLDIMLIMKFLGRVIEEGFILASPVLFLLLMTEVLLGVFSRFTPQLNAFSIALGIKTTLALFLLWMYFWTLGPEKLIDYMNHPIYFIQPK